MTLPATEEAHAPLEFRAVYVAHFDFVWRSLRRLGVDGQDARDAAHDVFVVVHRNLDTFRHDSKLTTWLFGICYRVAQARFRRRDRLEAPQESGWFDRVACDRGSPADRAVGRLTLEVLLDGLAPDQRAVFFMYEIEGMSTLEISSETGIAQGTVKSRLRLARAFLSKRLMAAGLAGAGGER